MLMTCKSMDLERAKHLLVTLYTSRAKAGVVFTVLLLAFVAFHFSIDLSEIEIKSLVEDFKIS